MLKIIEGRTKKVAAQQQFNRLVAQAWRQRENRRIMWRPSSRELDIIHDGQLWFVSVAPEADQKIKRYWNSFGLYDPRGGLVITVEINVPTESNGRSVSGFFARDTATGVVYLMHDGGVGGGIEGVGRNAFLARSSSELVPSVDAKGDVRLGIIVAPLVKGGVDVPLSSFVNRVARFKQEVRDNLVPTGADAKQINATYDDYYREFSGRKRGKRSREFEYISRHGDIVDELTRWRPAKKGERIVKNGLIDLGLTLKGKLRVLFEVKTSASRQNLYAAIGQILVHGCGCEYLEKYVVTPAGETIPADVSTALTALGIGVLRYELAGTRVMIA